MKKFAVILFFIFSMNLFLFADDINNFYRNDDVGFSINFPSEWGIYTSKENAIDIFKSYFDLKENDGSLPLFVGMTKNQRAYVRCLTEKTELDIEDYFILLHRANKSDKLSVTSAKLIREKNSVHWEYIFEHGGSKFKFYETVFTNGKHAIRLAFWTYASGFDEELQVFKSLTEDTFYNDTSEGTENWKPLWKDLSKLLPEKNIDKIEITDESAVKKKPQAESFRLTEKDKLFFYEIKGEKNKVYILGSIHLGHPEFYPMPERIEEAYRNSKYLCVEINIDSAENRKKLMGNKSLLFIKDDKTLKDILPENLYLKLENVFKETGMSIDSYKKMKPWVVSSVVVMFQSMSLGFSPQYGIDKYFMDKAKKTKEIKELENLDYQIDLFEKKINDIDYLAGVLLDYKLVKYKVNDLIKAWRSGDEERLEKLTMDSFTPYEDSGSKMADVLIFNRNNEMAEKIKTYLKDDRDYFVVVGAGHVIGEKGIVSLLKKAGFKAEKR